MAAEEIVKQLEMEQVEEMPTSTATSREPLSVPLYTSAMPSAFRPPSSIHTPECENTTHPDLPPLTGVKHIGLSILKQMRLCSPGIISSSVLCL